MYLPQYSIFPFVKLVLYENLLVFLDLNLGNPPFSLKNFLYAFSKSFKAFCSANLSGSLSHSSSFFKLVKSILKM